MHVHVIMHGLPHLPHCIIAHMHQCMFIFMCMFMVFKQSKTLMSIKEIKQNKAKQNKKTETRDMKTRLNRS